MISGDVSRREARIRLRIRGTRGREREVDAVIDTGYTGWLTLPPALIAELGLPWQTIVRGTLADGSTALFDVFEGAVLWDRRRRRIPIDQSDAEPLVGMALMTGYELNIQIRSRGKVTIKRLP
jgi:clan AA aspartic protease